MKGATEGRVREALEALNEDLPLTYWKPPDDSRNWKPADFLVWYDDRHPWPEERDQGSAFLEVKDNATVNVWPIKDLRLTQRAWIRQATKVGAPYLLVIWWRRKQRWTVSDARKVLAHMEANEDATSITYTLLSSTYGVDCQSHQLAGTLGAAFRGELA